MPSRKFKLDRNTGIMIEVTPESDRALCDEMSKSVKPYKRPLDFGTKGKRSAIAQWPYASDQMGCEVEDLDEVKKRLAEHGVKAEFERDGEWCMPVLTGPRHRKAVARALDWYDKNAGYGDPEPLNYKPEHSRKNSVDYITKRRAEIKEQVQAIERRILDRMAKK